MKLEDNRSMDNTLNIPVAEIMTRQLITVSTETSLQEVHRITGEHSIRHLPVLRKGKLAGIISRTDLERVSFMNDPNSANVVEAMLPLLNAENLMTRSPVTLTADQTVRDAAEIFKDGKIHALPVIEAERIAGIITTTDLIKLMLRAGE